MARFLALLVAIVAMSVPSSPTTSDAAPPRAQAPDNFRPRPGVVFNSPLGDTAERRAIFRKILRSVDSTPKGGDVKFFTWNFLTSEGTDTLLQAQRRGVRVRLLMDDVNNTEVPNGPYRRLRAGLAEVNRDRPVGRKSWARVCAASCRGTGGSAHAKFFMFSRVGPTPRVVMQGSANLTLASTNNQWNDIYTHTRSKRVWSYYSRIFTESVRDRPARPAYSAQQFEGFRLMMFPLAGKSVRDPVMRLLDQVRCSRATNTATGRTRIRIAPDVIRQDRGMRLARKVRQLWESGCDIRIGYTVLGIDVGRMLRAPGPRGPVPLRHLVQDVDFDGEFDNYFHLKAMSIVGHLGNDRSGYAVLNGSANWSGLGAVSDENLGLYRNREDALAYQRHIDFWYDRFGASSRMSARIDPFAGVVTAPDQLVFGFDENAVYEDGTPVSVDGTDPFASITD